MPKSYSGSGETPRRSRKKSMAAEELSNKRVIFKDYVTGYPKEEDMILTSATVPSKVPQGSTAVLLKNLYLSCDPYMRGRMSKPINRSYTDAFTPGSVCNFDLNRPYIPIRQVAGTRTARYRACRSLHEIVVNQFCFVFMQVIIGYGVSKVVDSGHPDFSPGDFVWGMTGWEEYSLVTTPKGLTKIKYTDVPLSYYTGILGIFQNIL
ncbi:hypothetical protein GW17_00041466 [Ensete ventricosum]|nr:hypothetical protein GW17_00041466 [Ensete ventricosum]